MYWVSSLLLEVRTSYVNGSSRNSSLVHDLSDPVTVHVNTAEAILRRGIRSHANLPVITNLVEFNYIENKTLETQFMVSS